MRYANEQFNLSFTPLLFAQVIFMSDVKSNEQVIWTPLMKDRRKNNRRDNERNLHTNGKTVNISDMKTFNDMRVLSDRRKRVTVTITGRAIDV